jgi:ABC-2 type transport system ATP-binding protein
MSDQDGAIRMSDLTKTFGASTAVDHLTVEVKRGELFGLVGPDGAGKTTTLRLLAAILSPTSGEAWVAGHSILKAPEAIKEKIGYMAQRFGLYEDLTVMENLLFYADLYDVPDRERPDRIGRLLGFSNLTPFRDRLAGKLSGGMKQKLGLACALIHTPEILLLDEPTCGVDPVSRRDFWKILYDLLKEGITIFVSTAYLDEAERCGRVGLLHRGRLLVTDEPGRIKRSIGRPMVEIATGEARTARALVQGLEGVRGVNLYGDRLHVDVADGSVVPRLLDALRAGGIEIRGHREIVPSLEDVFIEKVSAS